MQDEECEVDVALARHMIDGPCSAKDALERIDKYLDSPTLPRTKTALCKATIVRWRELGGNR